MTIDEAEVRKFGELSAQWWRDDAGAFAGLHRLNHVRVPLIRRAMQNVHRDARGDVNLKAKPLEGLRILDVGCGGGILSEPLARLGARVTGIDASPQNVAAATYHSRLDAEIASRVQYQCISVEDLASTGASFDGVVCSEVIEHVADLKGFLAALSALVNPQQGALVITTINRTAASFLQAIMAAEYVLRIVPAGTHEWTKFVTPAEIADALGAPLPAEHRTAQGTDEAAEAADGTGLQSKPHFVVEHVTGLTYNPFAHRWSTVSDSSVNYALVARRLR